LLSYFAHISNKRNTKAEDDDPEWDWDEEKPTRASHVGGDRALSGGKPRHRGSSTSPPFGSYNTNNNNMSHNQSNVSSGNSTLSAHENHISPRTERKGISVKKLGMNNPLNSNNNSGHNSTTRPTVPPASIPHRNNAMTSGVRKLAQPSTNDFFADMGFDTEPKRSGVTTSLAAATTTIKASTVTRLGAVALPIDASKDTWEDDDLDDLLG
jgi:hypothetical protein